MSIKNKLISWKINRLITRRAVLQAKYNETSAIMRRLESFPTAYPDRMIEYSGKIEAINIKLSRYGINTD